MKLTNNDYVSRALTLLAQGLEPIIETTLRPRINGGMSWTELLRKLDEVNGKYGKKYESNDLHVMLRTLLARFGNIGQPFDAQLGRSGGRYVQELQEVRNNWAHNMVFTDEDAYRAVDTAQRLLALMGAAQSDDLTQLRRELQAAMAGPTQAVEPAESPTPTTTPGHTVSAPAEAAVVSVDHGTPERLIRVDEPHQQSSAPEPSAVPETSLASIEISAVPVVSYAMAHNRLPVVSRLVVHMDGPSLEGAQLTIGIDTVDGPLGEPKEFFVDLVEGEDLTVPQVDFLLDPKAMSEIEEARPGSVIATLLFAGDVIARRVAPVRVLASTQWLAAPLEAGMELLAAFVKPNDPALESLTEEASNALERATGSGSFHDVYTDGTDGREVDVVVDAVMTAMRNRSIRYALPPASWTDDGQKIRTASEVLDGRLGTCLDTTVVLAAALERVGIRPLLFVVTGHAFLGYWRTEGLLPQPAATDAQLIAQIMNLIGLGSIGVVETTMLTIDHETSFISAIHKTGRATALNTAVTDVRGITDILRARTSQILPLPAKSIAADGSITFTSYSAPKVEAPKYVPPVATPQDQPSRPAAPARVEKWKNSLLDLSLRNRLINFPPSARLPLAVPDEGLGQLEDYLSASDRIALLPSDQISAVAKSQGIRTGAQLSEEDRLALLTKHQAFTDVTADAYLRKFRALAYKAKTIVEESGANNLYVALGSLVWTLKDREIRSPLILVPVNLRAQTKGGHYHLTLDESGMSTPNFCLLEKLRLEFNVTIPGLADPALDGSGIDLDAAFQATREAILASGIPARVEATVDVAILQFAKFRLWKDLDENWEALAANPLVRHLIEQPQEAFVDTAALTADVEKDVDLDELLTRLPISADSSQLQAVAAATAGRTFVLEGPPGTGKSQTITNLLAKSIADGKRVLFVAEKKAALQVVQSRLAAVGLGPFTLDLHDRGSRPNEIRSHLKKALAAQTTIDEDGLLTTSNDLDTARRALDRYARSLHEPNEAGQGFYAAHNSALATAVADHALPIPVDWAGSVSRERLQSIRHLLRDVPDSALRARPTAHHAWAFIDVSEDQSLDEDEVQRRIHEFDEAFGALDLTEELGAALFEASAPDQLSTLSRVAVRPRVQPSILEGLRGANVVADVAALRADLDGIEPAFADVLSVVSPEALYQDLIGILQASTEAAESGFFGRKKRQQAIVDSLGPVVRPGVTIEVGSLVPLAERLVAFQNAAIDLYTRANALPGVSTNSDWNPFVAEQRHAVLDVLDWNEWVNKVTEVSTTTDVSEVPFRNTLERFVTTSRGVDATVGTKIDRFANALDDLLHSPGTTTAGWDAWRGDRRLLDAWNDSRPGRDTSTTRGVALSH
ncbi:DUF4011 domain-containing protein [Frondihabitans peucedani]|uniref:AAA domain-containing protein n=1 Tax=Frondihabitans peucedani TaxID=598626 RepID=A0ABP8DX22_9MICO